MNKNTLIKCDKCSNRFDFKNGINYFVKVAYHLKDECPRAETKTTKQTWISNK